MKADLIIYVNGGVFESFEQALEGHVLILPFFKLSFSEPQGCMYSLLSLSYFFSPGGVRQKACTCRIASVRRPPRAARLMPGGQ